MAIIAAFAVATTAAVMSTSSAGAATLFFGPGSQLDPCASLSSPNGDYRLTMECGGNLVLTLQPENRVVWASGTGDFPGSVLQMQADGNLAVYSPGHVVRWATHTGGNSGSTLALQDDGNVVVVAPGNTPIWATDTVDAGKYVEAPSPGRRSCSGDGAGGWKFEAEVSDNDGLALTQSSLNGRLFTRLVNAPYLDGLSTVGGTRREVRIELTPTPDRAHPGVVGSTLTSFHCSGSGSGDIFVTATYQVNDFIFGKSGPGGLSVTQEYRFRGEDEHRCEPSGRLSCGRFWPTLSYVSSDPTACAASPGTGSGGCTLFSGARTVQRIEFRPDGQVNGGVDAYRDLDVLDGRKSATAVATKGSDGSMKYEDIDQAIVNGARGDWDSIHQSPTPRTSGPGVNPINTTGGFTPGCATCIHMHWAWSEAVNLVEPNFTDGRPQIEEHSEQSADFGIVRYVDSSEERDPVGRGWRALVDEKESPPSELRGHTPVVFWEMTGSPRGDSTFPVLDDYEHGGNGAIFFGAEHAH